MHSWYRSPERSVVLYGRPAHGDAAFVILKSPTEIHKGMCWPSDHRISALEVALLYPQVPYLPESV